MVDPAQLRAWENRTVETNSRQRRSQTARASDLGGLGVEADASVVRFLSGEAATDDVRRIEGTDSLRLRSPEGRPIQMVDEIVLGGHAYNLFRTIEATKIRLSATDSSAITFRRPGIAIDAPVTRAEFEALIERNLDRVDVDLEGPRGQ